MKTGTITALTLLIFITLNVSQAQEIDCNVTVNMEMLVQEARVDVSTMENDVESYIDNQRFTDMDWEGPKIPVDISIVLEGGGGGRYKGRMFIVAKRTLDPEEGSASVNVRMIEKQWTFEYQRFATLTHNPMRFHEFTSLIDYYMLLIIGFDMDTYEELGGTPMYEKAKQIVHLGASAQADGFSTYSNPGEFTKYNLVRELTDMRYEPFRKLVFAYYYDGLDQMLFDQEAGLEALRGVIRDMVYFKKNKLAGPSVLLQAFFDAKAHELATIFDDYPDEEIFTELMYLDPNNAAIYEEARDN